MTKLYTEKNIHGKRVEVSDYFLVKVRKVFKKKKGTIVGCYINGTHHPYVYSAFHVEFDDGTKSTIWAKDNTLV